MIGGKRRSALCTWLLVLNLAFIWGNSMLPASASGALSDWVKACLQWLLPGDGDDSQGGGLLRKLAHFSEFLSLGAVLCWFWGMRRKKRLACVALAAACGIAAACVDETIQHFSPGRYPSIRDVLIDAVGVAVGISLFRIGYTIYKKAKNNTTGGNKQ